LASISNVGVTSGKISHACQADFFPFPKKQEVVSHPVSAWNTGREVDRGSPRTSQIELTLMKRKFRHTKGKPQIKFRLDYFQVMNLSHQNN
jgi:hypothetical protein